MCDINWHQGQFWMISQYIPHIRCKSSIQTLKKQNPPRMLCICFQGRLFHCEQQLAIQLLNERQCNFLMDGGRPIGNLFEPRFLMCLALIQQLSGENEHWVCLLLKSFILMVSLCLGHLTVNAEEEPEAWEFSQELQAKSMLYTHFYPLLL